MAELSYIVVGLGNPGPAYEQTRHNVGFLAIDALAKQYGASYWKVTAGALVAHVKVAGLEVLLVKPQSFMNKSGSSVAQLARAFKLGGKQIIIIHDELDLDAGVVRCKFDGGHGGHNGLRSIHERLGDSAYVRIRGGIGRPPGRMDGADYVLQPLRPAAFEELLVTAAVCADAADMVVRCGITQTQNQYNAL